MEEKNGIHLLVDFIINSKDKFTNIADLVEPCDIKNENRIKNIEKGIQIFLDPDWRITKTTNILGFSRAGEKLLIALKKKTAPKLALTPWPKLPKTLLAQPQTTLRSRKLITTSIYPRMVDVKENIEPKLLTHLNQFLKENAAQAADDIIILGW